MRKRGVMHMLPWSVELAGRFDEVVFESDLLKGNPLGDPFQRPLWIYLPPGYDTEAAKRYPTIYMIQGFTGQIDMWRNRSPFRKNFPELADELFAKGEAPPCILVWVDCWTSLGGSQFVDSPATGRYHSYLCNEIVPWVDTHYRTRPQREHRGIAGKSSGGYGAMITPMLRPICGVVWQRTRATRCSRPATCRSFAKACARYAINTRGLLRNSGRISAADPLCRKVAMRR